MKLFSSIAAAALTVALATAAAAAPGDVRVVIGPQLQLRAHDLGQRDLDRLATELRGEVQRQIDRTPVLAGAKADLILSAATPNRPTFQQLSNTPGLSFESFGIGGATIDGTLTTPDGTVTPVHYRYYETDIRQAQHNGTWEDAEHAFDQFARNLSRGQLVASR